MGIKWNKAKIIKETKSIVTIVVVVFAFRSTFFEPFRIPTGSMIPSLMIGDFILVNKFAYGFKVPYSEWFGDPIYITEFTPPKRGDVVVFKYPEDPSLNYIKRLIGLPGDTIEIVDKAIYINDKEIPMTEIDGRELMADMDESFKKYDFKFYKMKLGEHEFTVQLNSDKWMLANMGRIEIPKDKYFVMGDNRDHSADSRIWGFVPKENFRGRALLVWFSLIFPWDKEPVKIRPYRIGTMID